MILSDNYLHTTLYNLAKTWPDLLSDKFECNVNYSSTDTTDLISGCSSLGDDRLDTSYVPFRFCVRVNKSEPVLIVIRMLD